VKEESSLWLLSISGQRIEETENRLENGGTHASSSFLPAGNSKEPPFVKKETFPNIQTAEKTNPHRSRILSDRKRFEFDVAMLSCKVHLRIIRDDAGINFCTCCRFRVHVKAFDMNIRSKRMCRTKRYRFFANFLNACLFVQFVSHLKKKDKARKRCRLHA